MAIRLDHKNLSAVVASPATREASSSFFFFLEDVTGDGKHLSYLAWAAATAARLQLGDNTDGWVFTVAVGENATQVSSHPKYFISKYFKYASDSTK